MLPTREPIELLRPPSPTEVIARWPADRPLTALVTAEPPPPSAAHAGVDADAGPDGAAHRGWSLLAEPAAWRIVPRGALGSGAAAVDALRDQLRPPAGAAGRAHGPGGWIACLAYELGRSLEPAARAPAAPLVADASTGPAPGIGPAAGPAAGPAPRPAASVDDRHWPDLALARVDAGLLHERATGRWWRFGPDSGRAAAETALAAAAAAGDVRLPRSRTGARAPRRSLDAAAHEDAVARAREAIASGEIFQANVTTRLSVDFAGSLRHLALAAFAVARPRYGALLEMPAGRGVVSVSPELFLELDPAAAPDRGVRSRPIKGTRAVRSPGGAGGASGDGGDPGGARRLLASAKDAAELAMIIDLMRNDLGRVAVRGGVRVSRPRHVETHPTVHHALAEVTARVPASLDAASLLAATFPPGSITGAPKIRAMQVIDRLEPVRRGAYCGSVGWIGDDGSMRLNVAIRTMSVVPRRDGGAGSTPAADRRADHREGTLDYGAGGGIVADSEPVAERREAELKAEVFRRTLRTLATHEGPRADDVPNPASTPAPGPATAAARALPRR